MADTAPNLDILDPERTLMSGLGARASALPTFATADTDKVLAKATAAKDPSLLPLMERKAQIADATSQALQIENEGKAVLDQAKTKLQRAASQREAQEYNSLVQNFGEVEKTAPELHPTKENMQSLASMFSLIGLIGTAMGKGPGNYSAMNALKSMTGMMQGWQQGDQARWNREVQEYDKSVAEFKTRLDSAQRKYNMGLQKLATDREAAKADMDMALAELGSPLLKATRDRQGYEAVAKTLNELSKDAAKVYAQTGAERRHAESTALQQKRVDLEKERVEQEKEKKTKGSAVQKQMVQRAINSLGGLASAVETLQEFPAGTTTGLLPNLTTNDGMFNYVRNNIGRKLSSRESDEMNTLFTGIGRNLASIESSGAATGLAELSKQMQSGVYINAGSDDPAKVAFKLADIRRIAEENIAPAISSGLMEPDQQATAQALVERIRRSIPFTTADVIHASSKKGTKTIGETSRALVASKNKFSTEQEAEVAWKSGKIKDGDPIMVGESVGTWIAPKE